MCGDSAAQKTVLLHMLPALTATHPFFDIPRERSRSYLKWARRLAQLEALLLLLGSCSLSDASTSNAQLTPFALGFVGLAVLWLVLAYFVGRGSANAAVILLGLSIARQVIAFASGNQLAQVIAPLILADLFLYGQAVRSAIALTRAVIPNPLAVPITPNPTVPRKVTTAPARVTPAVAIQTDLFAAKSGGVSSPEFKWPVDWVESRVPQTLSRFNLDFIVAFALVALALGSFALSIRPPGGSDTLSGLLVLYGIFHAVLAAIMFAAANRAKTGSRWGGRARIVVYVILVLEAPFLLQMIK